VGEQWRLQNRFTFDTSPLSPEEYRRRRRRLERLEAPERYPNHGRTTFNQKRNEMKKNRREKWIPVVRVAYFPAETYCRRFVYIRTKRAYTCVWMSVCVCLRMCDISGTFHIIYTFICLYIYTLYIEEKELIISVQIKYCPVFAVVECSTDLTFSIFWAEDENVWSFIIDIVIFLLFYFYIIIMYDLYCCLNCNYFNLLGDEHSFRTRIVFCKSILLFVHYNL